MSRILWEADNDGEAFPPDSYSVWCVEGSGSPAGSLSSLGSAASWRKVPGGGVGEEEEGSRLSEWGPKFRILSDMYDRPGRALAPQVTTATTQRSHSHRLLPQHH